MSSAVVRSVARRVSFGDVVRQIKEKVDPATAGLDRYVAGEHMETDDLRIRRWGKINGDYLGPAFHMRFRPGQVLYGSRRTYLRKVAVADFSGICANTTFILESKDPSVLLPELLPFLMQTEAFHAHSIKQSKGSVNPYINFSDLAWWDFVLPPIDQQRSLVKLLQAAESVLDARRTVASKSAILLRSAIDAMFESGGYGAANKFSAGRTGDRWSPTKLSFVTHKIVDGVHKRPNYVHSGIPFLTVENLTRGPDIDFETTRFITVDDHREFSKRADPENGDVLVSKDGTLGVARVVEKNTQFSIFVSIALLKPKKHLIDPWFLRYFFDSRAFRDRLGAKTSGSALKHIHLVDFRSTEIPLPSLSVQCRVTRAVRSLDLAARRCSAGVVEAEQFKNSLLNHLGALR